MKRDQILQALFEMQQPVSINFQALREPRCHESKPPTILHRYASNNVLTAGPHYAELFNQISLHICGLTAANSEPATKKRKLDEGLPGRPATNGTNEHTASHGGSAAATGEDPVLLEIKDISVVIPQRKKYTLCLTKDHLYARLPDSKEPVAGISFAWKDIGILKTLLCVDLY